MNLPDTPAGYVADEFAPIDEPEEPPEPPAMEERT